MTRAGCTIELFGCSGGMAEGFRRAGIRFDWCFDRDADACASYEANLGHRPARLDVRDLVSMVRGGWSPGPVDLLVADPPCAPWSRAGKRRGLADERDLLRETVDLIRMLRPRAYLIANVPGLDDGVCLDVIQFVLGALSANGYCTADFARLDAADYGVPQHRCRPFWFGHLSGACIQWPARTHCDPTTLRQLTIPGVDPLRPWVTCREALAGLSPKELGMPVRLRATVRYRSDGTCRESDADKPAKVVTAKNRSDKILLAHPKHPISRPDAPSYVIRSKANGGAQGGAALAWPWDRPSTVVCADPRISPPGHHGSAGQTGPHAVIISERAAAILQGFPGHWRFAGTTKAARWAQIGMAMPPPLAAAVAASIAAHLGAA